MKINTLRVYLIFTTANKIDQGCGQQVVGLIDLFESLASGYIVALVHTCGNASIAPGRLSGQRLFSQCPYIKKAWLQTLLLLVVLAVQY